MKRYSHAVSPVLLVFAVVAAIGSIAALKKESGSDPYTPTKQGWLIVVFESEYSDSFDTTQFRISTYAKADDVNTVVLLATAMKQCDRELLNKKMQEARSIIEKLAKCYGFDGWLIVREEINMVGVE